MIEGMKMENGRPEGGISFHLGEKAEEKTCDMMMRFK